MNFRLTLYRFGALLCLCSAFLKTQAADEYSLAMPKPGEGELRLLTPWLLELTFITTKKPDPNRSDQWDLIDDTGRFHTPALAEFSVTVNSAAVPVTTVGFKRRVLYAPVKQRDLRIANYLYLTLTTPVVDNQTVVLANPTSMLWPSNRTWRVNAEPLRLSPMIHVNQTSYQPEFSKKAQVGYYLGSLGEAELFRTLTNLANGSPTFQLIQASSGKEVFRGNLVSRPEQGFPFVSYTQVLEADFSTFQTAGEYKIFVPGFGTSYPFYIDDGAAAAMARTYALGLYHQRCGTNNILPYTRFTHDVCHIAPANIPTPSADFKFTWAKVAEKNSDFAENTRHTAPQLKSEATQLYPFVKHGKIDISGGHHDAGDYSKYTINSAALIHFLVFAADVFPGAGELDNLGIPESGDGKSDLLQEAKWEADFLAKMQDTDGGFYFLVYPREREYEQEALPDHGDAQVVWPKTTAATAAATAALAQISSSPRFKRQFPEAAALYLTHAKAGWAFLERAIAKFGKDGSYQKITHYGNEFMHDDELAWAACEMFLATGDPALQRTLISWFNPADAATRRWGWWRAYEGYGCAMRSYDFAVKSGRTITERLDPEFLRQCDEQLWEAGIDQLGFAQQSSYGTSFPTPTKRMRAAGWYFSVDQAFDLAVACQLDNQIKDSRTNFLNAIIGNVNFEAGSNPVNVNYLTGLGWKRQREIVSQYAQNDRRVLPPTGIPLGNVQEGFSWMELYQKELGALSFPADSASQPYPFYDRWGDTFNLSTEFVIVTQARGLACLSFLMGQTALKNQPWKAQPARIAVLPATEARPALAQLVVTGLNLQNARIVWEASDQEPVFGSTFPILPAQSPNHWVEAEAQWPDGRRVFGALSLGPQSATK